MPDEKEVQVETPEVPVTAPAQVDVVPAAPVTEEPEPEEKPVETPPAPEPLVETPKETPTPPENEAVPQSEWQNMQESIKTLQEKDDTNALEKFETEYPIVKSEKYKAKWDEIIKLKQTKDHKYSGLSYEECLNLIRDNSPQPEPQPAPIPVPTIGPSVAPDAPAGEIPKEVNDMMSQRFSQEEIDSTKR